MEFLKMSISIWILRESNLVSTNMWSQGDPSSSLLQYLVSKATLQANICVNMDQDMHYFLHSYACVCVCATIFPV